MKQAVVEEGDLYLGLYVFDLMTNEYIDGGHYEEEPKLREFKNRYPECASIRLPY